MLGQQTSMTDADTTSLRTILAAGSFATLGSVKTATWSTHGKRPGPPRAGETRTLRAPMFLKSIPTSRVTPSPKRRFAAATCTPPLVLSPEYSSEGYERTYLERILLLYGQRVDGSRELTHLLEGVEGVVGAAGPAAVTGAGRVLGGGDEAPDGVSGGGGSGGRHRRRRAR